MTRALRFLGWVSIAGCGSQVVIDAASMSTTTTTSTSTSTSTSETASSSAGEAASSSAASSGAGGAAASLNGNFMQMQIGNCINAEVWLGFGQAPAFTRTIVDRSFCGPHGVKSEPGTYAIQAGALGLHYTTDSGVEKRTYGYALVDPSPVFPAEPLPFGYAYGTRALNLMAYTLHDGPVAFHRSEWRGTPAQPDAFIQLADIDVVFDAPITVAPAPAPCTMTVTMSVSVSGGGVQGGKGAETWKFPCKVRPPEKSAFASVTADGFENSQNDGSWGAFLTNQGIFKKYPSQVAGFMDEVFRPVLAFAPSDPAHLFHDVQFAWYYEMKNPPPAMVP
jgi:hypothetical protein